MGGTSLASLAILSNVYSVYRLLQVVVWKRVIEINEGIAIRSITITIYCISAWLCGIMIPGLRFQSMSSAATGEPAKVQVASCYLQHPISQK